MICLNCKKQIPDNSASCPYCGNQITYHAQLGEEIKFRRYQRWFLYLVIVLVFLGMLGVIIKIQSANTKYATTYLEITKKIKDKESALTQTQTTLSDKEKVLKEIQASLESKSKEAEQMSGELKRTKEELTIKTSDYKNVLDEKTLIASKKNKCELDLTSADANIYSLIIKLGVGASNVDLMKIPVADSNLNIGDDSDSDGLSDIAEAALGTNKDKSDSDGDGFTDKDEILRGYNPIGTGKINYDTKFAAKNKGRILLQVEGHGEAWYVSPSDGKRYLLGNPADAFRVMRDLNYWTKDWKKQANVTEEQPAGDQVVVAVPDTQQTGSSSGTILPPTPNVNDLILK